MVIIIQKHQEVYGKYFRNEPNGNIANSKSFRSKIKITGNTPDADNKKNFDIAVLLQYLSNFLGTLEMPLINCEIGLIIVLFLLQPEKKNLK